MLSLKNYQHDLISIKNVELNANIKKHDINDLDYSKFIFLDKEISNKELMDGIILAILNDPSKKESLIEINMSNTFIVKTMKKIIKVEPVDILEIEMRVFNSDSSLLLTVITKEHKYSIEIEFPTLIVVKDKYYNMSYNIPEIIDNLLSKMNEYLKNYTEKNKIINM